MLHANHSILGPCRRQCGVSLVELMIGMTIGLFILTGALMVFSMTIRGGTDVMRAARLNQDVATAMAIMSNELRRAGRTATERDDMIRPLRTTWSQPIQIPTSSCILYSYDQNLNNAIDATERRGFARHTDGSLRMGENVTDCTGIANWPELTDPAIINVTSLTFDTQGSKCRNLDGTGYWRTNAAGTLVFPCVDPTDSNLQLCTNANVCGAAGTRALRVQNPADPGVTDPNTKLAEVPRINIRVQAELTQDNDVKADMSTSITVANILITRE